MERKNNKCEYTFTQKIRAFIAGLTPVAVFRLTLITSIIVALAAGIIYRTATKSLHVNINKVDTASIDLNGSLDLGGIEPIGYKDISYSVKNNPQNRCFSCCNTANVYAYRIIFMG